MFNDASYAWCSPLHRHRSSSTLCSQCSNRVCSRSSSSLSLSLSNVRSRLTSDEQSVWLDTFSQSTRFAFASTFQPVHRFHFPLIAVTGSVCTLAIPSAYRNLVSTQVHDSICVLHPAMPQCWCHTVPKPAPAIELDTSCISCINFAIFYTIATFCGR